VFRLWKIYIAGLFHNFLLYRIQLFNPEEIAEAIQFIVEHPAEAEQMGKNGRRAVEERYNWRMEEEKLLALYQELLA